MAMKCGKHRFLMLLYLTCYTFTISVAPSIAPASRGFVQGQPELQQAMDNREPENPSMKREVSSTTGNIFHEGYPALFKRKTLNLLEEAEYMLNRVKIFKERLWLQSFLYRLKSLEQALEENDFLYEASNYNEYFNTHHDETRIEATTLQGTSLHPNLVPLTTPATSINNTSLPKENKMEFRYPVTSAEAKQVPSGSDYHSDHQEVTKSGLIPTKAWEDDELVRELQSLHQYNAAATSNLQQNTDAHASSIQIPGEPGKSIQEEKKEREKEMISEEDAKKEIIKTMIMHEVTKLQRLGKSEKEIMETLHLDDFQFANFANPSFANNQKSNVREDVNKFKTVEDNQATEAMQRVSDLKHDEKITVGDKSMPEESPIYPVHLQPKLTYINNTYQHMLLHGPSSANSEQLINQEGHALSQTILDNVRQHHNNLKETILHLQKQDQPNFAMKNHMLQVPNMVPNYPHYIRYPYIEAPKENPKPQSPDKQHNDLIPLRYYPEYITRSNYAPYPYLKHWDQKNSTLHQSQIMTSIPTKSSSSHKIDAELSDDMKRQLRDGKIIVLSDSLVRANFTSPKNGEHQELETRGRESELAKNTDATQAQT